MSIEKAANGERELIRLKEPTSRRKRLRDMKPGDRMWFEGHTLTVTKIESGNPASGSFTLTLAYPNGEEWGEEDCMDSERGWLIPDDDEVG